MTYPNSPGSPAGSESILDLIQGTAVGDALETPLPSTPLEALQNSPLGPLLDTPVGDLSAAHLPPLPALPVLPPLPPNPIEALLNGGGLPALPGIDELLAPLRDLAGSFGTGMFGDFDPTSILDMSSKVIDQTMSMGMSGLKVLDQIWQSDAAQAARSQGTQAQTSGAELSERGAAISRTTETAAASVARGNANLMGIAESFAATAVAAAPMVLTPPGQAMLLASAAEHIQAAIGVVTQTRAELTEHIVTMNSLTTPVSVPTPPGSVGFGPGGANSPFSIASQVMEQVGKPIISTVTDGVGGLVSANTQAAGVASGGLPTDGLSSRSGLGSTAGSAGFGGGGAGIGMQGSAGGFVSGAPHRVAPGAVPSGTGSSGPATMPATSTPASTMGSGAPMGGAGMAGAGRGGDDQGAGRSTPGYLVSAGDSTAFGGDLPMVTPAVIGGEDLDDDPFAERS
ncbi:hypothetical protein [Rhodococcus marinonascens]|uniref:hypothetical protein n=1 Tax=Rhodococcus marinonascens TaxID=38311 RepID=UPI000934E14A|nr:hypothetical protein [Rhodococcus marinonascens]